MISGVDLELTETSPAAPPNGATGTPPTPALLPPSREVTESLRSGTCPPGLISSSLQESEGCLCLSNTGSGEFSDAA